MFPAASHRLFECNDSEQTNLFLLSIVLLLADTTTNTDVELHMSNFLHSYCLLKREILHNPGLVI